MEKNEKENLSGVLEPMVKAVLVADERTPWLEEDIAGLAAQDYKKIEFLLVLKGKEEVNADVDDLIKRGFPDSKIIRTASTTNYPLLANLVLRDDLKESREDMGSMLDNFYSPVGRSEKGENAQGQHDGKEIMAAPEAAMLIRADLFRALEGYDIEINSPDNNVEICLRSHLVGAKIV